MSLLVMEYSSGFWEEPVEVEVPSHNKFVESYEEILTYLNRLIDFDNRGRDCHDQREHLTEEDLDVWYWHHQDLLGYQDLTINDALIGFEWSNGSKEYYFLQ